MGNYLTCGQCCDFYRDANCRSNFEIDGLDMTIPKTLQEKRDKLAEQSVSREFYELHEADARVRHFKHGFDSAFNLLLPEIEKLERILLSIEEEYRKDNCHAGTWDLETDTLIEHSDKCMLCDLNQALQSWQRFTEGGE